MSDWELVQEPQQDQSDWEAVEEQPGLLKSLGKGYLNYAKGALRGTAQGFGDIGASVINAPISLAEYATGAKIPHVPHPDLLNKNPNSLSESIGQNLGQFTAGLGVPGGAGVKAAQLGSKAYKALRGAEELPLIGKLLAGSAGGAAEGALGSEGNRTQGAEIGGLVGGAIPGITSAIKGISSKLSGLPNIKELGAKRNAAQGAYEQDQALVDSLRKKYADEHAGATDEKNMHLREIEHYLGKGETSDVELAKEINSSLQKAKQHIQKNYYEPVENYTKDNYVQIPRTPDIKEIEEQLQRLTKDPEFMKSPGFDKIKESIIKQKSGRDLVPADDFVKQWKETKQAASKARRKGFQEGGENQSYWQDQAAKLKELADKQLSVLKEQLPKEHSDKLLKADQLWREEITPFYGNKIREQAKKFGRIDVRNIMNEVRGQGMGQEKMKELLLANPKLTKLAIGHTYAKEPEKLLSLPQHEQEFVDKLPELKDMLNRLRQHNHNVNAIKAESNFFKANQDNLSSKENLERLDKQYKEALKNRKALKSKLKKGAAYGAVALGVNGAIKKLLQ